ncbi:MAG: hypothetical protein PHN64_08495 [Desulfovibrionaceae bacterium]|nr:hypothetical protein [Desulfovibrionaceae bacterium]
MAQINNQMGVAPAMGQFEALTQNIDSGRYVYLRGNRALDENSFMHLFTRRSVNIATTEALRNEITAKFGQDVSDALRPTFDSFIQSGKQMTVGTMKSIFTAAADTRRIQQKIDAPILQQKKQAGCDRIDAKNWPAETKALAKEVLLHTMDQHPNMFKNIEMATGLPSLALATIFNTIDTASGEGTIFHSLQDPQTKKDFLTARCVLQAEIFHERHILDNLQAMRQLQPQGNITYQTAWRACFQSEPPHVIGMRGQQLSSLSFDAFLNKNITELINRGMTRENAEMGNLTINLNISSGISLRALMDTVVHPRPISLNDFAIHPQLSSLSTTSTLKDANKALIRDFYRQEAPTVISIQIGDQTSVNRNNDLAGMTEQEKTEYRGGKPTQKTNQIFEQLGRLCNGNEAQLKMVTMGLTQAGPVSFLRSLSQCAGRAGNALEHSAMEYSLQQGNNGDVIFNAKTPDGYPVNLTASYTVHPDGSSTIHTLNISAH